MSNAPTKDYWMLFVIYMMGVGRDIWELSCYHKYFIMHPRAGGRKHWLLIVDEATDYAHSIFLKQKVTK